jgi:heme-degrading monooxygenase HmoA
MYARSTTVHGNPQSLDDAIAYLRDEVMPAAQRMDGCIGMSMMCDRDTGRCIATTAWESEEAMHNSEGGLHDMRKRYAQMLGGTPEVQEWEITLLHRMHHAPDGACCRVLWSGGNPDDVERVVDAVRMTLLSRIEDLPGFCSVSMLVDRRNSRTVSVTSFETREAAALMRKHARSLREQFALAMGAKIVEVAEMNLALAHLRVPETV